MAEQALSAGAGTHTYLAVLKDTAALHIIDSVRCKVCYTFFHSTFSCARLKAALEQRLVLQIRSKFEVSSILCILLSLAFRVEN